MSAFVDSEFRYCPLIWLCHSRTNKWRIDRLHESCLRIIYSDKQSSFKELLEKDNSVFIHEKNAQIWATEKYKVSSNISSSNISKMLKYGMSIPII